MYMYDPSLQASSPFGEVASARGSVEIQTEQSLANRFTHHKWRLAGQYVLRSWAIKDTHESFSKWDLELFL